MKKAILISSAVLALTTVYGQTNVYHPFPDSGAVWAVEWYVGGPPSGTGLEWYSLKGSDTVVNSLTYKKFYMNSLVGGLRQDNANKKIYFIALSNNYPCFHKCITSECLLYDFNAGIGDTVFYGLGGSAVKVNSIDSVQLLDGTYRKRFNGGGSLNGIIEGIGTTENVLCGFAAGMTTYELRCFRQNNMALYFLPSPEYASCPVLTGTEEISTPASALSIYPNPFSTQTVLQTTISLAKATLIVTNCFGQAIKSINNRSGQTIVFHRDNLPRGLYFIRIMQDGATPFVGKFVITDK